MALDEFALIRRYFANCGQRIDVVLGVGDDAALVCTLVGHDLVVTVDTLVEGVHFFPQTDPGSLGHKALAVNLSDLAAMGAEPAWVTLALTLPASDPEWLAEFSRGFTELADAFGVQLIGGDTTRGPLAVSVQAMGFCPSGRAVRRSGARPGDRIYVTGTLGDAGLALAAARGLDVAPVRLPLLRQRLDRPSPRVAEGLALRSLAHGGIDISDGLAADLGHVLEASGVGARIFLASLPLSEAVAAEVQRAGDWRLPLGAGDDYELCLTIAPAKAAEAERVADDFPCDLTCIGVIESEPGLRCIDEDGRALDVPCQGWNHFAFDDG